MIIIWGKKIVRGKAGMAAHWCPVCGDLATFDVIDVSRVPHLYYVPAGRKVPICREFVCRGCRLAQGFAPKIGAAVDRKRAKGMAADLAELATMTSPWEPAHLASAMERQERVRSGQATPEDRQQVMTDLLAALSHVSHIKVARGRHQSITALVWLLAIIGLMVSLFLLSQWTDQLHPSTGLTLWLVGTSLGTIAVTIWGARRGLKANALAMRGEVLPLIVRGLTPLRPTQEEVAWMLELAATRGEPIGRGLKPAEVMAALDRQVAPGT